MMRILLVDDEPELTEALGQVLTKEGYGVDIAGDGEGGWQLIQAHRYDLLILDWMLPQLSGIELCGRVRSLGSQTPVLILTAKDTLDDRVMGLDAGADDYLVKPFQLRELLARVRALLRRSPNAYGGGGTRLKFADLELDLDNQTALRQGRSIALSEKETQLLAFLMQNPGRLLSHGDIQNHLWPDDRPPSSNVLAALMRLVRRKIEQPPSPPLIHTVYGKGYRFDLESLP